MNLFICNLICICSRKTRRPDQPVYVPRALRSQNAASVSQSVASVVWATSSFEATDEISIKLSSVDLNNDSLGSKTVSKPSDVTDFSNTPPDCSLQSGVAPKPVGRKSGKQKNFSSKDGGKKTSKSLQKSMSGSATKTHNNAGDCLSADASHSDDQSNNVVSDSVPTEDEASSAENVHLYHVDLAASLHESEACDKCRQTFAELEHTAQELSGACLLKELETSSNVASSVTCADVDDVSILLASVTECENAIPVSVHGTSVPLTQESEQQQLCSVVDKQLEAFASLDISTNQSCSSAAVEAGSYQFTGNSDIGDVDVDDESWEKMFDESGEKLPQLSQVYAVHFCSQTHTHARLHAHMHTAFRGEFETDADLNRS